jgi:hypothetical protein
MKKPARKNNSIKKALIPFNLTPQFRPLLADGTSVTTISGMQIKDYSNGIIAETIGAYDLKKLKILKIKNKKEFLSEGRKQIIELWKGIQHLTTHTEMFVVIFHIGLGNVLNEVESYFASKSKYVRWLKEMFGNEHLRYFQHAKQLAKMGDFAERYSSLGKNRLLEFDRLRKLTQKTFAQIIREHPFPDTAQDIEGKLTTEHIDSIVTYYRLKDAGVDVDFDQASLMAAYNHSSVEVRTVKKIKERLDKERNKKAALEKFLMNKMAFPGEKQLISGSRISLNKILADLVSYCEKADLDNKDWVKDQKELIRPEIFTQAFIFLGVLKNKLGMKIPAAKQPQR